MPVKADHGAAAVLETLPMAFSVCKVETYPEGLADLPWVFTGHTDLEKSLVCPTDCVPESTLAREDGWRAFRVRGCLDFGLVGILSGISGVLSGNGVPLFAVSTFETDYVLVKEDHFLRALNALKDAGYRVEGEEARARRENTSGKNL